MQNYYAKCICNTTDNYPGQVINPITSKECLFMDKNKSFVKNLKIELSIYTFFTK